MPRTEAKDPRNVNRNYTGEIWTEFEKLGIIKDAIRVPPWRVREVYQLDQMYSDPRMTEYIESQYADELLQIIAADPGKYKYLRGKSAKEILGIVRNKASAKLEVESARIKAELHEEDLALPRAAGLKWVSERLISRPEDYALLISGMTKKKKNYYASWDGKYSLMTMSVYESPFIRFEGPPGGGKSSGMTMSMEESAWRFGAWIRSNIPIPPKKLYGRQLHAKTITDLGDLFLNDPPGTSVLLAPLYGVWVIVGVDEHGMALEGYTKSQINNLYEELFWLRRHLKVIFYSTGVSSLPPGIEQYVTKKILCESRNYGKQKQFKEQREFRWKIQKRISGEKYHEEEIVYRIPAPEIEPEWGNENEMAGPMSMGISIKSLLQSIDTSAPNEQMAEEADFYVRFWRSADSIPIPEGIEGKEARAAYIQEVYESKINEIRERFRNVKVTKSGKIVNREGFQIRTFYECQDCGNRWMFSGKGRPRCTERNSCGSYNVKPLSISKLTSEEFNQLEYVNRNNEESQV